MSMFLLKAVGLVRYKEIKYFGTTLQIPTYAIAIATDSNGAIYAYEDIPECDAGGDRGYGGWLVNADRQLLGVALFNGDWKDSLMLLLE